MKRETLLIATGIFCLHLPLQAKLVAHYKFDEPEGATTAINAVAGGTNGTIAPTVIAGAPGISGTSYIFGPYATDFVDMGNASFLPQLTASGQLTFSAWVNTDTTLGNRNIVVFAGNDAASNVYADLSVSGETTPVGSATQGAAIARNRPVGSPGNGTQPTGIFSTAKVNDGQWHHLAMTVNTATAKLVLYVDGVEANNFTMPVNLLPVFNNFEVGRLGRSSPTDYFEGLIDDVQVYDHALSASEIQYLFTHPGQAAPALQATATITSAVIDGANFKITFTGTPSTTFNLRGSLDLVSFNINHNTVSTDGSGQGTATVPLVAGRTAEFYRLETIPAP